MKVSIRPLQISDANTSYKWRNDKEVFKYTGNTYDHEITLESELSWIKRVILNQDEYRCAIEVEGVYIGNIYLTDITSTNAQYHIFIGEKKYWGKGIAKQASTLLIKHAACNMGIKNIYLYVHVNNKAAIILYTKLGFIETSRDLNFIRMNLNTDCFIQNNNE